MESTTELNPRNTESFNTKIKEIDGGIIEVDIVGQSKDIVHDHVKSLDNDDYKNIRLNRLKKEECRARESYAYSNVTDDRFPNYEYTLFQKELEDKHEQIKNLGVSYMGANGYSNGFSRRDRWTLQHSNNDTFTFKDVHQKGTIKGFHNVTVDMAEDKSNGGDALRDLGENKEPENKRSMIDFDKVLEFEIRDKFGLMNGRRPDINEYLNKAKNNYTKNDSHNTGSIGYASGRFRGGHERINYLNQAQNNNEKYENDSFTASSSSRINLDSYFYDYGNKKKANDVIIDKGTEPEDDDALSIPI